MRRIVVTGSTRGIGRGLAEAFLARGCAVAVSGRSGAAVSTCVAELAQRYGAELVTGRACEVTRPADLQALWDAAAQRFGGVDVWINNAGLGLPLRPLWEQDAEAMQALAATNLGGLLLGSRVALRGMMAQGSGHLWNMEGFGSGGEVRAGMSAYGASKRAVRYLHRALQKEVAGTPLRVGALSPGIVITDFITGDYDLSPDTEQGQRNRRIFNILGDLPETVTPWLAERVLRSEKSGERVAWLTTGKAMRRFFAALFRKRNLFAALDAPRA